MMRVFWAIFRRELGAFYGSLTGYVITALALFLIGLSFLTLLAAFNGEPMDAPITEAFYSTPFFWIIILFSTPAITMRSFAHEKSMGTFESLVTVPVRGAQIVGAKFAAAWCVYGCMWLPFVGCTLLARRYMNDPSLAAPSVLAVSFCGMMLVGSLFLSLGCLASAFTRSHVTAAILGFAFGMVFFLLSFSAGHATDETLWYARILKQISLFEQLQDFVRGIVDVRHLVFFLSLSGLFLYGTWQVVESRNWK